MTGDSWPIMWLHKRTCAEGVQSRRRICELRGVTGVIERTFSRRNTYRLAWNDTDGIRDVYA